MEAIAIFDVLRRYVLLIVALCIVTTLAGYGISFVSAVIPTKYDAAATVLVRPHNPIKIEANNSGKEVLGFPVAQTPVVESASKTYIQIIQSPALVAEVVRKLGLDQKKKKEVVPGDIFDQIYDYMKELYNDLQEYVKDAIAIFKYGRLLKDDPFTKAVKDVTKGLTLKAYEDTNVFEIKYSDADPQRAADVANNMANSFIDFLENMRSSEATDAADRLKSELEQSRERLVAARESLRDYKASHGVFLYKEEYDAKLRVISDLTVELAKLDQSLAVGTFDAKTFEKKRATLLKILEEKRAELVPLPMVERELLLRQSDIEVANTTYETVAKQLKDVQIKADALSEARLISPAFIPQTPEKPRRDIYAGAALLAGLVVGLVLTFFLEYINRTVRGISDVEDFVGLKVVATIPRAPQPMLARLADELVSSGWRPGQSS